MSLVLRRHYRQHEIIVALRQKNTGKYKKKDKKLKSLEKVLNLILILKSFLLGDTASREPDRESASNTGVAGASITGSVASSSYVAMKAIGGRHNRLEVSSTISRIFICVFFNFSFRFLNPDYFFQFKF